MIFYICKKVYPSGQPVLIVPPARWGCALSAPPRPQGGKIPYRRACPCQEKARPALSGRISEKAGRLIICLGLFCPAHLTGSRSLGRPFSVVLALFSDRAYFQLLVNISKVKTIKPTAQALSQAVSPGICGRVLSARRNGIARCGQGCR